MSPETERLPCRGCTRDCPNYAHCGGKPWRLCEQFGQSLAWAGLRQAPRNVGSRSPSPAP